MKKIFLSKHNLALVKECIFLAEVIAGKYDVGAQLTRDTIARCRKTCEIHIYNTSIGTPWYLFLARIYGVRTVFYCHEPNKLDIFKFYRGFTLIKHFLIKYINFLSIILCNECVCLSQFGLQRALTYPFMKSYSCKFRVQNIKLPKITIQPSNEKNFNILVFGQLNATKKPYWIEDFLMNSMVLGGAIKLNVVTASKEFPFLEKLGVEYSEIFSISRFDNLSDETISMYLNNSFASIHLHHCVTQSGAFVESLRHGVPSVCLNTDGFNQFYEAEIMELLDEYSYPKLDAAISTLFNNQIERREKCLRVFDRNFTSR